MREISSYSEGVGVDMVTIQRGNTKVANKLISYAEKRAEVREGVNCPSKREYAKGSSDQKRTRTDSSSEQETTRTNDFDINEFNKKLTERQRGLQEGYYRQYRNTHESDRSTEQRNEL